MKKVENKELTIKDLEELWNKHASADEETRKEMWKNEDNTHKLLLGQLRNTKNTFFKVITDKIVVDDIWATEVDELSWGLKHYNINEFILKQKSSQAMDILIRFLELGWEVAGTEDWAIEEKHNFTEHKRFYEPQTGIVIRKKRV